MAQPCRVCHHPDRDSIDAALVAGDSPRAVGKRYGIHGEAVRRHLKNHLSPALAAMRTEEAEQRRASLLERVETLIVRAEVLFNAASAEGKSAQALAVIKELRGLLELLGKATGELATTPTVTINLQSSPEWLELRGIILGALAAFPEARQVVAGRLLQLEAGPS